MRHFLSIRQPFAWGVVHGLKRVENRSWECQHRGFLWIHAGKSKEIIEGTDPEDWFEEEDGTPFIPNCPPWDQLAFGAIIGAVDLVDCVSERVAQKRLGLDPHIGGPFCFLFENPRVLRVPVPWVGNVGLRPIDLVPKEDMFVPLTQP